MLLDKAEKMLKLCKIVLQIRKSAQRNRDMPSVYAGHVVLPDKEAWIFGGLIFSQKFFFREGGVVVGSSSRDFLLGGIDHGCTLLIIPVILTPKPYPGQENIEEHFFIYHRLNVSTYAGNVDSMFNCCKVSALIPRQSSFKTQVVHFSLFFAFIHFSSLMILFSPC